MTGANRGIGYAIAGQLAERDIHVVATARDIEHANRTATDLISQGWAASGVRLDVTEPDTIAAAVQHTLDQHGRIDILVNNAGISDGDQQPSRIDLELVSRVWEVNVLGAWQCAEAVVPAMRAAGYGRIVNLSSTLGSLHHMTRPTEPAYRVSKAALNAVTRVLAAELADTGILVNSASPGWVRTDLGGPNAPRTVEQGADTPVWLATLPDDGPTGGFFYDREPLEW
ncbi:NAD(P)-dependent dehydrogenase (short-subunit alcohol dehydrogenase family) [Crossiella equi]|uniref:NAD(P)-dependent dehydrogenase (Short-subunit alcohol dehydrogenase family) n=1 Tax=Crossiella equi TaxID=130796 RepID=A0ABS5AE40_9PSEU|nr:SDR family oxidoreductase [Crossiella equi]MBP2474839.1 NAD(P)-dependent dehydrogenase (short-subunit alcohol dehydrogenase family) [Crossiella equi]